MKVMRLPMMEIRMERHLHWMSCLMIGPGSPECACKYDSQPSYDMGR